MHIRLEDKYGALIAVAEIENGHRLPCAVMWQCRCFISAEDWAPVGGAEVYREATVYHLNEVKSNVKEPSCASGT